MCGPEERADDARKIMGRVMNTTQTVLQVESFTMISAPAEVKDLIQECNQITSYTYARSSGKSDPEIWAENILDSIFSKGYYFRRIILDEEQVMRFRKEIIVEALSREVEIMFLMPSGKVVRPCKEVLEFMNGR